MTASKQLYCDICKLGPFKNVSGLSGHLQFQHQLKPGRGLTGVPAEQLVKGQEQLAERMAKLEGAVSELAKQVPERLGELLSAYRGQVTQDEIELAEAQDEAQEQLAERMAKLEGAVSELAKQVPERFVKGQEQLAERMAKLEASLSGMVKQLPERLDKALAAHRERHDTEHQEVLDGFEDLERKLMPAQHLRAG